MLDLLYLFLMSAPILAGLTFVVLVARERRRTGAVAAWPAKPRRR